ncbi:hypothetical protein [Dictyobacter kobayashii]|uniref:Uncharacterized protein n=1 Tax=Dictyobacter kobayashii TaxID=2014872 RepID=A0A402ARF0_9CHLR|nr:hypothetical protein [Dictyobacter kobayashii]GCE21680.1 hypothetical protein KDK_54800 [Dictyobacter kobayashii]
MTYFWETIKQLPKPVRTVITIGYLCIFLFFIMDFFNIPLKLPDYAVEAISVVGLCVLGFVLLYGGFAELRLARKEGRKPVFYKYMALYGGIAFIVAAVLLLYSTIYPQAISDTVGLIVICICLAIIVISIAPAIYHDIQITNRAGKDAAETMKREQEQKKAEQERLLAEGKPLPQPEKSTPRNWLQVALASMALLLFLGGMIIMIVNTFTKSMPYDVFAIDFSCSWLCWSLSAIMMSQDKARLEQRSWHWPQHISVVYTIAGVFFVACYITHYLLVTQQILSKGTADMFNIVPLIVLIAVVICSGIITNRREKAQAAN